MKNLIKLLGTVLILIFIISCATVNLSVLDDPTLKKDPDKLELKPAYDIYFLREDLVRATHVETKTSFVNGKLQTITKQVENDYSELVIDFGNGIILDYNNNLCVDLVKYYGLDKLSNFRIEKRPTGFSFDFNTEYTLTNNNYQSNYNGYRKADIKKDLIQIENGLLKEKRTIIINENEIELNGSFLGVTIQKAARLEDEKSLIVKGFWKDDKFIMETPESIVMNKIFKIINTGDHLTIIFTGIFGINKEMQFYRTKPGLIFFDEDMYGLEITKSENIIKIKKNGMDISEYIINENS